MIETFFDREGAVAHGDFQRWRARHFEDGYFLNVKSPSYVMLHRSACPHLEGTDWLRPEQGFGSLTKSKKVCSTHPQELEHWASENATATLSRCKDCERL